MRTLGIARCSATLGIACFVLGLCPSSEMRSSSRTLLSEHDLTHIRGAEGSNVEDDSYTCEEANIEPNYVPDCNGQPDNNEPNPL